MRNLFLFIRRFYPFFLFLFLEVIAVILIARSNAYQGATMVNSANQVSGWFYTQNNSILEYFRLKETNIELAEENARLRATLGNYTEAGDSARTDTTERYIYSYLPARVINHSIHKKMNYFTLDKGSADGLRPGLGVVESNGVVGMLTNVSQNYAVGISMLNSKTRVSVRHKRSGAIGIMRWKGSDITAHVVDDITKTAGVKEGDTLVTSGYSTYFPEGLPVAVVTRSDLRDGSNFYDITSVLTNEIFSLDKVYVVFHQDYQELDSLETVAQ